MSQPTDSSKVPRSEYNINQSNASESQKNYYGISDTLNIEFIISKLLNVWQLVVNYFKNTAQKVQVMDPIPRNFDYDYAFNSYYYRTIMMVSHTLGLRLGDTATGSNIIYVIFSTLPLALLTYILIPVHAILLHKKTSERKVSFLERRVLLTGLAFLLGLFVSFITRHYISPPASPPVYFMPAVVGGAIQIIGPQLRNDRRKFLACTVGSASFLAFLISTSMGAISIGVLLAICDQTINAIINVQVMVYDVSKGDTDMTSAHIIGLTITMVCHTLNKVFFCTYDPDRLNYIHPSFIDTAIL